MRTSFILALTVLELSAHAQIDASWSSVIAESISRENVFQSYLSEIRSGGHSLFIVASHATGAERSAWLSYESWHEVPPTNSAESEAFMTAIQSLFTELPTAIQSYKISVASRASELGLITLPTEQATLSDSLVTDKATTSAANPLTSIATTTAASSTSSMTVSSGAAVSTGGAQKEMGIVGYVAAAGAVGFGAVAALL